MSGLSPFDEGYVAPPKAEPPKSWTEPTIGAKPKASAEPRPRARPAADEPDAPPDTKPVHPTAIADGIYFGLDADAYHAIERLSSSGICKLIASPAEFWEASWLNDDKADEDDKPHFVTGRAYHTARLEPHLFDRLYVRELARSDFPAQGACWTGTDVEAALAALGEAKTKAGEKVADKARRLAATGYRGTIYPLEQEKWEEARGDRTALSARVWKDIERDGKRLRQNPDLAALISDGEAEVSVFWTDEQGRPMKARLDYLRVVGWTDLKTFDPRGKPLEQAIPDAIRFNLYFVQAAVYREAVMAIRTGQVAIQGEASEAQRNLVAALQLAEADPECWYVFQQKGGVPNILGRRFHFSEIPLSSQMNDAIADREGRARHHRVVERPTQLHRKAGILIRRAKRLFDVYSEVYQRGEAWLPINALADVTDDDFNEKWLEAE